MLGRSRRWALPILAISLATFCTADATETIPNFRDFLVSEIHTGKSVPAVLSLPAHRTYQTRLRYAAEFKPNFAGHYIVTYWGCGTLCRFGAVLDALTGKIALLPFSISGWGSSTADNFEPMRYCLNSRLIIFSGERNESEDMGIHFYVFQEGRFTHLKTIPSSNDFRDTPIDILQCDLSPPSVNQDVTLPHMNREEFLRVLKMLREGQN